MNTIFRYIKLCSTENTTQLRRNFANNCPNNIKQRGYFERKFGAPSAEKRKTIIGLISRIAN